MTGLERLQVKLGRYAIPHLGLALVFGQAIVFFGILAAGDQGTQFLGRLSLDLSAIARGEVWRLLSFVFVPPTDNAFFLLFGLLFVWFTSGALESRWGSFRFNLFLLVGWIATLCAAGIVHALVGPTQVPGALFLSSIFFAFAWLWPEHRILLFFVIPIAVKWIALVGWIGVAYLLVMGDVGTRLMTLASVSSVLIFCGADMWRWMRRGGKAIGGVVTAAVVETPAFHTCATCGVTEKKDPTMRFRGCTDCRPVREYCMTCLAGHVHRIDR